MPKGNIIQEFTLKNMDETRNYFNEEINQNELMSKKVEKVCTEHLLILAPMVTRRVSISAFTSLVGIPISIALWNGIKICAITAEVKKYKPIIKKSMMKHYY